MICCYNIVLFRSKSIFLEGKYNLKIYFQHIKCLAAKQKWNKLDMRLGWTGVVTLKASLKLQQNHTKWILWFSRPLSDPGSLFSTMFAFFISFSTCSQFHLKSIYLAYYTVCIFVSVCFQTKRIFFFSKSYGWTSYSKPLFGCSTLAIKYLSTYIYYLYMKSVPT